MSQPKVSPIDGVLLIDKPSGMTSFDVVKRVKRLVGKQKVGHTGTLDPMATGLLPVCIGEATKLSGLLSGRKKRYRARLRLGLSTDTLDREGKPVDQKPVPPLTKETIEKCLWEFVGEIEQVPPMFSAVHHQGKRLYQLARQGLEVERQSRRVEIGSIELVELGSDVLELDVICGSGTYIRTLAADIAERLGTLGHLEELTRTEASGWTLDRAVSLEKLDQTTVVGSILPVEQVLEGFQHVEVDDVVANRLAKGRRLRATELQSLGIQAESEPITFWMRGPSKGPLILARTCPAEDPQEPAMEILRVLFPHKKTVDIPGS